MEETNCNDTTLSQSYLILPQTMTNVHTATRVTRTRTASIPPARSSACVGTATRATELSAHQSVPSRQRHRLRQRLVSRSVIHTQICAFLFMLYNLRTEGNHEILIHHTRNVTYCCGSRHTM